jgi:hypothetical protein
MLPSTTVGAPGVKLLKELSTISFSFLRLTGEHRARPDIVFGFLDSIAEVHGEAVEKASVGALNGLAVDETTLEIFRIFEAVILNTVSSVEGSLGNHWGSQSEQGVAGQVAFESKASPPRKIPDKSNESLSGMLMFLTKALKVCPVFMLHLPLAQGAEREDEQLLRQAVDSSVASLNDSDPEVTRSAIVFLKVLVRHANHFDVAPQM